MSISAELLSLKKYELQNSALSTSGHFHPEKRACEEFRAHLELFRFHPGPLPTAGQRRRINAQLCARHRAAFSLFFSRSSQPPRAERASFRESSALSSCNQASSDDISISIYNRSKNGRGARRGRQVRRKTR